MDGDSTPALVLAGKLHEARKGKRLSTREVAAALCGAFRISHATIANYEKGRTVPSSDVLAALADLYGRPLCWFTASAPSLAGVRYRNLKSKVRVADCNEYQSKGQQVLEAYVRLERHLKQPLVREVNPPVSVSLSDEEFARHLREALGFDNSQPIPSVIECLERLGVRTIELPTDLAIDAFAARYGDEYVIVLNSNTPNDRCRLDAAHEVVHVLLGDCDQSARETKEIERRAFRIGSLFLLPETQLRQAFAGKSLVRLLKYKETFGISLAAMVYRAQQSKIISERETTWLWREFAKRGWRREEPGYVRPDRAMRFEYMLESAIQTKKLTWSQAESLTGVSESELRQRLNQALGIDPTVQEGEDEPPQTLKLFG